jgi:hypothetical protein
LCHASSNQTTDRWMHETKVHRIQKCQFYLTKSQLWVWQVT